MILPPPPEKFKDLDEASSYIKEMYDFLKYPVFERGRIHNNYLSADSMTVTVGSTSDTVEDLQENNALAYVTIVEATGAPGINMELTYVGVDDIKNVHFFGRYQGSASHAIQVQMYDYSASAYIYAGSVNHSVANEVLVWPVLDYQNLISDDGESKVRFYHSMSGNASHDFYLIYVALNY